MARKAKDATKTQAENGEGTPGPGHNGGDDSHDKIKFFNRCNQWIAAKEALEQLEEEAKTALGKKAIRDFRTVLKLKTDKGEAAIKERIERDLELARWMNLSVGSQADLFPTVDRTPIGDRAYAAGELAALTAGRREPPHAPGTEAYDRWLTGYADQNERILRSNIKEPASEEDRDLRPRHMTQPDA